ncbi:MAG: S9 family peptidase [Porphyromonadaceae bacterium]|nr:S9 family peptidase [Porphyromonadaceae bacterium]
MKHFFSLILFFFVFHLVSADLLTDITDGKYRAKSVPGMKSMNDGEHYTLLENNKLIVKYSYKTGKAVDTIFNASTTKLNKLEQIKGYDFSPNELKILVYNEQNFRYRRTFTSEYYVFDVKRNELKPLSENGPQEVPLFSPDSRYIAFARENNLYLHKLDFGTESPITKDGEFGTIINGTPDWVYEEEFVATRYFVFSPDSKLLAFVRFDETDVPTYQMQRYLESPVEQDGIPLYPTFQSFKYPKAGQPNSKVSVCVYDDFYKSVKTINLGVEDSDFYIPRIKWTREQEKLAIFVLNRNQNQLDMIFSNPKSLVSKLMLRENNKYYVDFENIDDIHFTNDGKYFTFVSERDGWRHAYLYNINGSLNKQLTQGNFDVTKVYGFDDAGQVLYYQSAEISPLQRDVYSTDAKNRKTRLTDGKGFHNASFSSSFAYFLDDASELNKPNIFTIRNNKGETLRTLEDNAKLAADFDALNLPKKEFFKFTTSEGVALNGWMIKPQNFNPNIKYPALMVQYSGPNSQEVKDSWKIGWEYYLASQGYVVACVDGRGTAARGSEFRNSTYMQLGVLETKDQIEGAKYLGNQSFVDKNRIGIWGWSYGGFMTLNAMSTDEKIFKAGISVAPVTDWRLYNSAYTERFMRQPKENNGGYDAGSPLKHADKFSGNLLIIHGTADDNVHVQNTYLYLDALLKAGKQAELYLYSDKNHSILGKETRRHLYKKKFDFLERALK